jgi:hypothetical protein|tara:strand:- start:125 stop:499 length:375 start_codon:yes stop_codon:yes gene_type:complete
MKKLLGLLLFLSVGFSQITDKNFKSNVNGGVTLAVFESDWQEQPFDKDIISDVKGFEGCKIIYVKSEDAPKASKKLRLRNFPSMVLFYDGSKKETWKADMDGELDCDNKEVKKAISNLFAGDLF